MASFLSSTTPGEYAIFHPQQQGICPAGRRSIPHADTPRVHRASRRGGRCLAGRRTRAAAVNAGDRVSTTHYRVRSRISLLHFAGA